MQSLPTAYVCNLPTFKKKITSPSFGLHLIRVVILCSKDTKTEHLTQYLVLALPHGILDKNNKIK